MAKARKGKFLSLKKQVVSYLDSNCCIMFNGEIHSSTIRHSKCEFLMEGSLCKVCSSYCSNLNFMKQKSFKMSSNDRYMGALQRRKKNALMKRALHYKQWQLKRLREKILTLTKHGVEVDESDFMGAITDYNTEIEKLPIDDFKKVFWKQQVHL